MLQGLQAGCIQWLLLPMPERRRADGIGGDEIDDTLEN